MSQTVISKDWSNFLKPNYYFLCFLYTCEICAVVIVVPIFAKNQLTFVLKTVVKTSSVVFLLATFLLFFLIIPAHKWSCFFPPPSFELASFSWSFDDDEALPLSEYWRLVGKSWAGPKSLRGLNLSGLTEPARVNFEWSPIIFLVPPWCSLPIRRADLVIAELFSGGGDDGCCCRRLKNKVTCKQFSTLLWKIYSNNMYWI